MSSSDGGLSKGCVGAPAAPGSRLPLSGDESIMSPKKHGTTATPVQANLRWGIADVLASRICSYNRHYAEPSGSWVATSFLREADRAGTTTFFDSVTGRPLFMAPRGRSFEEWERESRAHGWPSFRDEEVVWDDVRVLPDGEAVSVGGTHLGHNLPDKKGNRYCINLCSVAGRPADGE
jgi:peptide methionine sulfoxide reductase MsrB